MGLSTLLRTVSHFKKSYIERNSMSKFAENPYIYTASVLWQLIAQAVNHSVLSLNLSSAVKFLGILL